MSEPRTVIVDGARTPIGRYSGSLKSIPAYELGAIAVREALCRSGVEADDVDEVIMGCIGQVGPDTFSARDNNRLGDRTLIDGTLAMLTDPFTGQHRGVTAENVAEKYGASRAEQDQFAAESQCRAGTAEALAAFAEEITPVKTGGRSSVTVSLDEHPRPKTRVESLSALRPVFREDGTVTAGNSSGVNDGAAAVVLMKEERVRERGLGGPATLEYVTTAALEPEFMGYAPTLALQRLFKETGLEPTDVGTIALNEAFASQAVAVIRDAVLTLKERIHTVGPSPSARRSPH